MGDSHADHVMAAKRKGCSGVTPSQCRIYRDADMLIGQETNNDIGELIRW